CVARLARGFLVVATELPLGDVAVIALQLLLGAQLRAIVGKLARLPLAVLAGSIGPLADGALVAAPDVLPHAAVKLEFGGRALGHACFGLKDSGIGRKGSRRRPRTIARSFPLSNAHLIPRAAAGAAAFCLWSGPR